jgi:hypothetical protein
MTAPYRRAGSLVALGVVLLSSSPFARLQVSARQAVPGEYDIKAAYLYNFVRFVRWPEDTPAAGEESFQICIVGEDLFGVTLDRILAGEDIEGRALLARRLSTEDNARGCRILFIARSEESNLGRILASLDTLPILTVSDLPRFARRGGMVEFVLDNNRVRFEIDLDQVQAGGLDVASELLRVASAVRADSQALS